MKEKKCLLVPFKLLNTLLFLILSTNVPILHSWSLQLNSIRKSLNSQDFSSSRLFGSLLLQKRFKGAKRESLLKASLDPNDDLVYSSLGETSESTSPSVFMFNSSNDDWIQYLNDDIILQDISVQYSYLPNKQLIRGVKAVSPIDYNDPVVSVPLDLCLEVTNLAQPTPLPQIINQTLWESSLWYHRLAYKLLYNYLIMRRPDQYQWFEQLPRNFTTPIHWRTETVLELQYPSLEKKIPQKLYEYLYYYQAWKDNIRGIIKENKHRNQDTLIAIETITVEQFIWALECIQSRSFSGVYEGSSFQDRRRYLLLVLVLSAVEVYFHLADNATVISIAIALLLSSFLKDFFLSKVGNFKRYVFCPVIDLFNHKSDSSSDVSYNYFLNRMDLFLKPPSSVAASSSSSSELLINYGFQSNDRFLLNYGFIEENNPHDIYDFDQNIIELLLELDKNNDNTDGVNILAPPSSPSPEERIRFLSTLFYSLAPVDVNASDRNKINNDAESQQRRQKTSKALIDRSEENKRTVKYHRTKPQQSIGNAETITARMNGKSGVKEHFDGITNAILLALYSSPEEWKQLFPSTFSSQGLLDLTTANQYYQKIQQFSFNSESIKRAEDVLRIIIKQELSSKPTTLEEDEALLSSINEKIIQLSSPTTSSSTPESKLLMNALPLEQAIRFRVEKKRLLKEGLDLGQ